MKLDSNGYAPSIMGCDDSECFICGWKGDTVRHEVFYGTANRKLSKKWGCWVTLCVPCHQSIHTNPECKYVDQSLKQTVYEVFCRKHGKETFRKVFGRTYD